MKSWDLWLGVFLAVVCANQIDRSPLLLKVALGLFILNTVLSLSAGAVEIWDTLHKR